MDIVELFKVLSDLNRLRILNLLLREKLCVCELQTILGMTQSNTSRHLNKLKDVGIIEAEKSGQWMFYKISERFLEENDILLEFLRQRFETEQPFCKDLETLRKYKSSFTCKDIRERKDVVKKLIYHKEGER
ncbi:ArsR/SmtB family transcription factor [Pseudothermotoga thermarum]|uniref:Transcriptional regulator, ArsR family n=1 Tax=Pseudothermotoga thermarum DSM 5069 TaxID=688269 RepID=F7YV25_9THEM|nr:metalloregulator ArsR/SmtB family transcription factor [Pseudothermotoga thermarum]AEH50310.1 transcriptional regulator, ArsR family [Pseudothermotoga thermarum DSM 5069]